MSADQPSRSQTTACLAKFEATTWRRFWCWHRWRVLKEGATYHLRCDKCGAEQKGANYG
jgi:hypothetical protein